MAVQKTYYLNPLNTQVIQAFGLQDVVTGSFLNSATVTATLLNDRGVADGVLQGIVLGYMAATDGNYQGTVPATFNAPLGGGYILQILVEQGGVQSLFSLQTIVELRRT
jgi:hypothetical protein